MFDGPLAGKAAKVKCSYLLLWLGDKGREVFSTWQLEADDLNDLEVYIAKFQEHITPKVNTVFARFQFLTETKWMEKNQTITLQH